MKSTSMRVLQLFYSSIFILVTVVFLAISFQSTKNAVFLQFKKQQAIELERIDLFISSFLQEQKKMFEYLVDQEEKEILAKAFNAIDELLFVDFSLHVKTIYKRSDFSSMFVGYSLQSSDLGKYLEKISINSISLYQFIRSPNEDNYALYLALKSSGGYYLARYSILSLVSNIKRIADFSDSILLLVSSDGFVELSTHDPLPFSVLPESISEYYNYNKKEYSFLRSRSINLFDDLVLLTDTKKSQDLISNVAQMYPFLALLLVLTGIIVSFIETQLLIKPVINLAKTINKWIPTEKEIPKPFKNGPRELEDLYNRFAERSALMNKTLEQYIKARDELKEFNMELENKVSIRTEELKNANSMLEYQNTNLQNTLETLTKTQDQLVAQEKMAILGRLSANVAHELNTPLGAIVSSVTQAQANLKDSFMEILALYEAANAKEKEHIKMFLEEALDYKIYDRALEKARMIQFKELLSGFKIDASRALAISLSSLGLDPESVLSRKLLTYTDLAMIVEKVEAFASVSKALNIIQIAGGKAAHVVDALKKYSWENPNEEKVIINLTKELEQILALYEHSLAQGVVLKLQAETAFYIEGNPDRINQVWINLINNAIQAVFPKGIVSVSIESTETSVIISVHDTGVGIPDEIKPKIFTPFFTTKPKGQGTGLGLDICKRIVEGEGGRIYFTSETGNTTFSVEFKKVKK